MPSLKSSSDKKALDQLIVESRQNRKEREKGYRDRALKMFPWICAKCGREFTGKQVRELTVHHIDHDHDHNPPDGSNWELLCLYCHDDEHSRHEVAEAYDSRALDNVEESSSLDNKPFADLARLLKDKQDK